MLTSLLENESMGDECFRVFDLSRGEDVGDGVFTKEPKREYPEDSVELMQYCM